MGSALEATRCKERQSSNMKYLVLLALFSVAFADAEPEPTAAADPWLYYGGYYGGLGHGYYGGYGLGYGYGHGHYGYGLGGYVWGRKKRSAEAEPTAEAEADPWLYYGGLGYYGRGYYGGYYGLGHRGYIWG